MDFHPTKFLLILLPLQGCVTNETGARSTMFDAHAPVLAILADNLFTGSAVGYIDMTGTLDLQSQVNPSERCIGSYHFTGQNHGVGTIHCNSGLVAEFQYNSLSLISGYGFGSTPAGPVSFTYGLTVEQSAPYLTLPKGKTVRNQNGHAELAIL